LPSLCTLRQTRRIRFSRYPASGFYKRPASEKHPFGYGKERFFWSFIAAIFIFGVGASYALYEGFQKLWHTRTV
jgi:divalent metal cation (Fe/Co/Zn/Cd) transporter